MFKVQLILTLLVILSLVCQGQQTNNWYFGDHAGITFNTTPPSALTNSQMYTNEGCATVSDSTGNLLFYTDGRKVWDRTHTVMPNGSGLLGDVSSTHSAIVIPKPGSRTIYYIFTCDAQENLGAAGYRYSEVDMTLNGGLGDINTTKNILLYGPCTEKLTAASCSNGIDIWIITKERNNHVFRSYKVTCNGIDNNPVFSTVAAISGNTLGYNTGCIKVSPDGTRIANARNFEGKWDLFKFDNATGIVSDRILITETNQLISYGIEFSPNSKLVYVNADYTYQFKIDTYDSAAISNSKYNVDNFLAQHGALQLGPDNKIYSNSYPNTSVIDDPNTAGSGCNFLSQFISLAGRNGMAGFPTFFGNLVTNYNLDYTYNFLPDCKTVQFAATSAIPGPLNWAWDFGDGNTGTGQNITHVFPSTPNQFLVTLTINNPNVCGGTAIRSKTIYFNRVAPTAKFGYITACNDLTVTLHDSSTIGPGAQIVSYNWDFGDGNTSTVQHPVHTYLNYGTYPVRLIVESNDQCHSRDTMIKTINVAAKPVAHFSVADTCYKVALQFNNQSAIAQGLITSWYWDFGDGNSSDLQNPSHLYSNFGTYLVKLVVKSQFNCISDTFSLSVKAGASPLVDFSLPAICLLDATAGFTNNTSIGDNSSLSYLWNFGDPNASPANPNSSTLQHPTHIYSVAAVYNVKLSAATNLGCKDSITKVFTVNGAVPKSVFRILNPGNTCSDTDAQIKDSAYVDFGIITRIKIYWGDGDSTIDNNPAQVPNGRIYNHHYTSFSNPAFKTYTIIMHAYSGVVCADISSQVITIHASPEISFGTIPDVCNESLPVIINQAHVVWGLTGTGTYSGSGITNGATGSFDPQILSPGTYPITYSFVSTAGCRTDSVKNIVVNPTPSAAFSFTHACLPNANVQFASISGVAGGNVNSLQHAWNFGDAAASPGNPNTSAAVNPSHVYHSLASYDVQLQVISNKGCKHDTLIRIYPNTTIFPRPSALFKVDSLKLICEKNPVYFINQSDGAGQAVTSYNWQFGDGGLSSAVHPSHTYPAYGQFPVILWIQNEKGCVSDTFTKVITVQSTPVANFSFDSACFGKPVQFRDRSTNALGAINSWYWDLGNGNTATQQNPLSQYNSYRSYTVILKVATANGCASNPVSKSFFIRKVNVFAGNDTSIARNQPLQLQASGASTYTWTPATGLNNNTIANPVALLNTTAQTYYLKGTTAEGCLGFDTINIKVFDRADVYMPNAFTPNNDGLNDYLHPILIGVKQLNYFRLYDRWGKLVFFTYNQYDKWDGRFNGQEAEPGVYVWEAQAISFDGSLIQRRGTIMLVR